MQIISTEQQEIDMKEPKIPLGCETFDEGLKKKLKDTKFKKAWEDLDTEFAVERALIELRMQGNETQKKLADKLHTKQAYISRVERGSVSPTVTYIARMADALNADAEIIFRPRGSKEIIIAVLVKRRRESIRQNREILR
jgi:DNA-binding XRE family transcriptional regulator